MSKVAKQNSTLKTAHIDHNDKVKSTKKSTTNGGTKEEKKKIAKVTEIYSIDEKKKIEKTHSTSTKTASKIKNPKIESKTRPKIESKTVAIRNENSVQKVLSVEKSNKKQSTSTEKLKQKRSTSVDEPIKKRPKEKSKEPTQSNVTKTVKSTESLIQSKNISKHQTPLKASHAIGAKSSAATTISSKNVMNQVHNVTVSSPPPVRREIAPIEVDIVHQKEQKEKHEKPQKDVKVEPKSEQKNAEIQEQQQEIDYQQPLPRGRTRTRTLEDDEIVLLKSKPNPERVTINGNDSKERSVIERVSVEIRPPISFEVQLDDTHKKFLDKRPENRELVQTEVATTADGADNTSENESENYEDDFESYESDFESDLSDEDEEVDENGSVEETSISSGESDTDENVVSTASKHPFETGHSIDNSEFDSGSFEMKVLSSRARERNEIEAKSSNRHDQKFEVQNDSGIENNSNTFGVNAMNPTPNGQMNSLELNNKTFDNISDIENEGINSLDTNNNKANSGKLNATKSRFAKRGEELLSKITLDNMNYVLFDCKPIPYEVFMKIYGNSNTTQISVQTHNDRIDQECQSDAITMRTSWSQCPVTFYTEQMSRSNFDDYKNGCGTENDDQTFGSTNDNLDVTCENSLKIIRKKSVKTNLNDNSIIEMGNLAMLNIDYDNLNRFLLESEMTISTILDGNIQKRCRKLNESALPICNGFFILNPTINANFEDKRIHRIFTTDALAGFVFTLHRDHELDVIGMWNLISFSAPVCLLSVWSKVVCLEIHPKIKDIVFAGLDDGSIAVWDYSESKYWHPNLNKEIKRFVPSQITTPTFDSKDIKDFGRCVSIRGLPISADTELLNGYNPKQMCSLHECGLLILWTVLNNATGAYTDLSNKRIDHQSMWSKVKLIQNKAIDLRSSVRQMAQVKLSRPSSKSFNKTRSYFESELFSDVALQELHSMNAEEEKILTHFHCTAIELTREGILISTNENFLLFGRKSFKNESFRRIQIDSNKSVRVECMVALSGFDDDIVVIALNNGAVKSLCCDQNVEQTDDSMTNSDVEESFSSMSSSQTPPMGDGKASNLNFPVESFDYRMASPSNGSVQIAMAAPLHANFMDNVDGSLFGKSCTIQSLVQNERKIYDEMQALNHLENNEKMPLEIIRIKSMQRSVRCTQLISGQIILNNSLDAFSILTRQCIVQLQKSKKLISLCKNRLRIYDLLTNQIINVTINQMNEQRFVQATATTANQNEEYLILLNTEGVIELHQIKIDPNTG